MAVTDKPFPIVYANAYDALLSISDNKDIAPVDMSNGVPSGYVVITGRDVGGAPLPAYLSNVEDMAQYRKDVQGLFADKTLRDILTTKKETEL
jgi:hypothetical protein